MFVKIKYTTVNFDNVANFWFERKKEDWTIDGKSETKYRYFIHLEYLGYKHEDLFEVETEKEWVLWQNALDHLLKTQKIEFKDEE